METKDPFEEAVNEAINRGILKDYLERKGPEVVEMLHNQFDYEIAMNALREEVREEVVEDIARKMLANGVSLKDIEMYTGLTEEVLAGLK